MPWQCAKERRARDRYRHIRSVGSVGRWWRRGGLPLPARCGLPPHAAPAMLDRAIGQTYLRFSRANCRAFMPYSPRLIGHGIKDVHIVLRYSSSVLRNRDPNRYYRVSDLDRMTFYEQPVSQDTMRSQSRANRFTVGAVLLHTGVTAGLAACARRLSRILARCIISVVYSPAHCTRPAMIK